MGLNLKPLVISNPIRISDLVGKVVAVDAFNVIYQFLATIRGPTGDLLTDTHGEPTSHLSGLFYRNINLLCDGVKMVYIFDGEPHELKAKEINRRKKAKEEASEKYNLAIEEGRMDDAKKFSQGTSILTSKMIEESKYLLSLLGIPYINAISEGEATAALLSKKDLAYSCVSQDYDSILFGAKRLIRNLTISGKRKIPNKNAYIDIVPEIIEYDQVLKINNITHEQLVDIGILIGTDFNPNGFNGIGPKNALKLIQKYKKLEDIEKIKDELSNTPYKEIREIFLNPNVANIEDLNIQFKDLEKEKILKYLCDEKSFSMERVANYLRRLEKNVIKKSESLDKWF
ncbi:flap endonuclease-1 [Candidatus Nitrosocosmicus franklandus]|uniref:Flap endonuclease 1 n=1 Tax=Candidatus Nitrosocosmicus franklandianus TaxID=1798806 RepID=A0A484IB63_9ARCH|nr:flap endonuclease-1 [Candidatus Nitrosocosmicus franklandus]VFJ14025.1 Flap endonuclease 1 [Candidatus Nitrosocosmicus franklandus]